MNDNQNKKKSSFGGVLYESAPLLDQMLRSICYLHHECCLQERHELVTILEQAVESIVGLKETEQHLMPDTAEALRQYSFLSRFRKLSYEDKLKVLDHIDGCDSA